MHSNCLPLFGFEEYLLRIKKKRIKVEKVEGLCFFLCLYKI